MPPVATAIGRWPRSCRAIAITASIAAARSPTTPPRNPAISRATRNPSSAAAKKQIEELRNTRKRQQYLVEWLLILGVPLLFGAYGVTRWRMRLAARENISLA